MEANGGAAKRSSLVDVVDAARAGDTEAVEAVVSLCRPELLRLARSIDGARAEQVVDDLLASFVGWLDHLRFDTTPEVWFYLYQGCRELMSGGALAAPPELTTSLEPTTSPEPAAPSEPTTSPERVEPAPEFAPSVDPIVAVEPVVAMEPVVAAEPVVVVAAMAAEPGPADPADDEAARPQPIGTSTGMLRPRRLSVAERLVDAVSAQRSLVTASLLTGVLVAATVLAATRWDTMHVLDDVNLVSVDGEDVAEPLIPAAVEGGSDPQSPLGPGPASNDGGRAVFTPPSSEPTPAGSTTTSEVTPESTTTTATTGSTTTLADPSTTSTSGPTTSTSTTVVPPTGPRVSVLTTTSLIVVLSPDGTSPGASTSLPVGPTDETPPTTRPPQTTVFGAFSP